MGTDDTLAHVRVSVDGRVVCGVILVVILRVLEWGKHGREDTRKRDTEHGETGADDGCVGFDGGPEVGDHGAVVWVEGFGGEVEGYHAGYGCAADAGGKVSIRAESRERERVCVCVRW